MASRNPPTGANPPVLLVVDDDQSQRLVMSLFFTAMGWQVATAQDGCEGLIYLTGDRSFDVVVTDMRMPRMNGLDMVRQWRVQRADGDAPPVLLVSSLVTLEMRSEAEELGIRECLERPLNLQNFAHHLMGTVLN